MNKGIWQADRNEKMISTARHRSTMVTSQPSCWERRGNTFDITYECWIFYWCVRQASENEFCQRVWMRKCLGRIGAAAVRSICPSLGKGLWFAWYIRYIRSPVLLTAAAMEPHMPVGSTKWLHFVSAAAVCYLRCDQSGTGGETTSVFNNSFPSLCGEHWTDQPE